MDATVAQWTTTRRTRQQPRTVYAFLHDDAGAEVDPTSRDVTDGVASRDPLTIKGG
jgi:hypothetical protein